MIRDERINKTQSRTAAGGFGIMTILLSISLLYRVFFLGQPVTEYWDVALIYFIGTLYVTITSFARGAVYENAAIRLGKRTIPVILIAILLVSYFQGNIHTLFDFLEVVISALISLSVVGILAYALYRRWERQNVLSD